LLCRQATLMERLAEDASRFALKQDAARQGTVNKQEREAAWRAARVLLEAPQAQYDAASPVP
jgi:DnaJ-domain-containing protein 1